MKYLITIFTILFVSSIFVLSAYGIETGVSDEVSSNTDTTKSAGNTGLDKKSMPMTQEMMERNQPANAKLQLKKKKQVRLMDSKDSTNGTQTSTSNDLNTEKNIKPNSVKVPPSPRPAPVGDRPQL